MFARLYHVNDVTKSANVKLWLHATPYFYSKFVEICLFKRYFKLLSSKHAESIKYAERLEKSSISVLMAEALESTVLLQLKNMR